MRELILTTGSVVLLDDIDYNYFWNWSWFEGKDGYAYRTISHKPEKKLCIHIEVAKRMGIWRPKLLIDHVDRNKSNCQRENIRVGTKSQNSMNVSKRDNTSSRYKGVYFDRDRGNWVAQIKRNKNTFYLGSFKTEEAARDAYDSVAPRVFGDFALTNQNKGI